MVNKDLYGKSILENPNEINGFKEIDDKKELNSILEQAPKGMETNKQNERNMIRKEIEKFEKKINIQNDTSKGNIKTNQTNIVNNPAASSSAKKNDPFNRIPQAKSDKKIMDVLNKNNVENLSKSKTDSFLRRVINMK